jgi:translation elongation factor EF-G
MFNFSIVFLNKGVEAQTMTVWKQADKYKIPRIIFVNKMDRADSSLELSCKSIEEKLEIPVLRLQLPLIENGSLVGRCKLQNVFVTNKTKQNICILNKLILN